ncbi:MAG TPA: lysylphosphatidylglycerol synthase transmembrane domain-containing protein [Chthoniobacterales bacterium]|nr:lysylphosphatidylglycerol synthase transmembrane domain-containing protein [Chthoniobacterales bacterium]
MNKRRLAFFIGKIVFAFIAIAWLSRKVDLFRVWDSVREARGAPIVFGIVLSLVTIVIAGWRWQRLLAILDITIPLKSLICIVPVGAFFSIFLPGSTGDDLTRMLYISRLAPGRVAEACTTVVLDRCIGLSSILLLGVIGIPWQWSVLSTSSQTHWIAVAILAGGGVVCLGGAVFFLAGRPTHRWFERRLRSRPAHSLRDGAARIWGLLCDHKLLVGKLVGAALLAQVLQCISFYLAGVSVGIDRPLLMWLTFLPVVFAANALPITIAGIGVREYLLILFLGVVAGVDSEHAFAASFIMFSMMLSISLLGGLLYIFYRPKSKLATVDEVSPSA